MRSRAVARIARATGSPSPQRILAAAASGLSLRRAGGWASADGDNVSASNFSSRSWSAVSAIASSASTARIDWER